MTKREIYICDICGKQQQENSLPLYWKRIRRFIFHYELRGSMHVCGECWDQLKAMREANMMAERKEE